MNRNDNEICECEYTAIDFETAVGARNSICQVGIAVIKNGKIVKTISELVQPPENKYSHWNIQVHGIYPEDTANAPLFPEVWEKIRPYIEGKCLIAHNSAFDESCLRKTLDYYHIPVPEFKCICTYRLTNMRLDAACNAYGIVLDNHHDATADAVACGELFLKVRANVVPDMSRAKSKPKRKHTPICGDMLRQDLSCADPRSPFYNQKVVITGVFDSMERTEIVECLQRCGAKVNTNVSGATNYLIKGRQPGPAKMQRVKALQDAGKGIRVLCEDELGKMLK